MLPGTGAQLSGRHRSSLPGAFPVMNGRSKIPVTTSSRGLVLASRNPSPYREIEQNPAGDTGHKYVNSVRISPQIAPILSAVKIEFSMF